MIHSFFEKAIEDIYHGINSKRARKKLNPKLWNVAQRKLDMIDAAFQLEDLKAPPSNNLEALRGNYNGKHSIRNNDHYRIIFFWDNGAHEVEIIDYH